jgi:hypothetical protein
VLIVLLLFSLFLLLVLLADKELWLLDQSNANQKIEEIHEAKAKKIKYTNQKDQYCDCLIIIINLLMVFIVYYFTFLCALSFAFNFNWGIEREHGIHH